MSDVRTERMEHLVPLSAFFAGRRDLEPVSGFEPLTVRLQGGCSAKLSYTGRLTAVPCGTEPLLEYRVFDGEEVAD